MAETIKVFELAKELNLKALDLLDKIKPLDLKLKNHMADLSAEQAEKIRSFVQPPKSETATAKKTTVRKKAAAKEDPSASAVMRPFVVKAKSAPAPLPTATISEVSDEAPAAVTTAVASEPPSQEESVAVAPQAPVDDPVATPLARASGAIIRRAPTMLVKREPSPQVVPKPTAAEMAANSVEATQEAPAAAEELSATPEVESVESSASDGALETPAAPVAAPTPPRRGPRYSIIRVVSVEPDQPRRPLIVEEAPTKGRSTSAPRTFTDPVLARTGSALLRESEAEEERRKKSALSARAKEEDSRLFKSTDYLRRERVYQPKKKKISIGRGSSRSAAGSGISHKRTVEFDTRISVENLAEQLAVKVREVVKKCTELGVEMPDTVEGYHDWYLDLETTQLVVQEFNSEFEDVGFDEESMLADSSEADANQKPRSPVVTIMGHVDHGKTSLLDTIRKARVASGEAGGITQHIGAYTVLVADAVKNLQSMAAEATGKKDKKDKKGDKKVDAKAGKKGDKKASLSASIERLTFLDTPGHAAFSSMRARGAKVTDIVVLVVSAVDGVMPQTKEAVDHAKAAGVPLLVAVNKIDLPEANPDRIKQQLGEVGIVPEEWGGETIFVNLSAKTGEGVDKLLENIQILSEVLELTAKAEGLAEGAIVEAKLDKGRGPLATVLVKSGVLKVGDFIVAGTQYGKVRALINDKGQQVKEAGPSTPVEILGLSGVPEAGEQLNSLETEKDARVLAEYRTEQKKQESAAAKGFTAEALFALMASGDLKELPLIIKSDVKGSAEAINASLMKLPQNKVRLKMLSVGVGGISESDVLLASASKAMIIGFNVRPDNNAEAQAERLGVQIKCYSIIYELLDEMTKAMEGLLDPTLKETVMGRLEVRNVFSVTKTGQVAGCYVLKGKVQRSNQIRLLRDNRVIFTGKISGLRRFKDDAKEVAEGFECGLSVEGYNDIKVGDQIEAYMIESSATKLSDGPSASA